MRRPFRLNDPRQYPPAFARARWAPAEILYGNHRSGDQGALRALAVGGGYRGRALPRPPARERRDARRGLLCPPSALGERPLLPGEVPADTGSGCEVLAVADIL